MVHLSERGGRGRVGLGWMVSVVAALLLLWGCGESGSPGPAPVVCAAGEVATPEGTCRAEEPPGCPPGELLLESGKCQPAGLPPDMECPPGEWPSADGTCQAAGIPPEACAEGFEPDGNGGCNAILPAEACPFGQMAVPGETSCREVAPCGDGPWGTIPVEANTQFVDQAYAGGDSDGTMAKPWTTVQQGVDAAASGAIVAVTDGDYMEDVRIEGKAVRLWGRCPGLVEIQGTGGHISAVQIFEGDADGSEIRDLAVTGVKDGIAVVGASDVRLDQVWVHDAEGWGIDIESEYGPTSVTVRGSLVEQNHEMGVFVMGWDADAELEATVVRDTRSGAQDNDGIGLFIQVGAKVAVRKCVIQRNYIQGVGVHGADAELEATVVSENDGFGVQIGDLGRRANASIRGCVVEQNRQLGVRVEGSDAELDATVVRETLPSSGFGDGIYVNRGLFDDHRAKVRVLRCMVEQNHRQGLFVDGSADVDLEATVVRGQAGFGIYAIDDRSTGVRAQLSARGCVLAQNHLTGVWVVGSDAELVATVVRDTQPADGWRGVGIEIGSDDITSQRGEGDIHGCVVERNNGVGISIFYADGAIKSTIVRDTKIDALGSLGDGIIVFNGAATIQSTTVSGNARAGVANFASEVTILSSTITCNAFDLNGEPDDGIPYSFDGSAGWQCSRVGAEDCTETDTCLVLSAGLEPPPPLDPLPPQP